MNQEQINKLRDMEMPKCDRCGRFHKCESGSAWKMVYSGYPPEPDHEISRCKKCVEIYGEFYVQNGIKPEYSCGLINQT